MCLSPVPRWLGQQAGHLPLLCLYAAKSLDVCFIGGCLWVLRGEAADIVRSPSQNAVQEARIDSKHTERTVQCARAHTARLDWKASASTVRWSPYSSATGEGVPRTSHVSRPFPVCALGGKNLTAIFRFWARDGDRESV